MVEFELRDRDLLARIGKLKTKTGTVETPVFIPVINPAKQSVSPRELWTDFGCRILITNAYIIRKQQEENAKKSGIHSLLDFPGVVMTDSGAYQILTYGNVDISPEVAIRFQEEIDSDIATILDIPTGWKATKERAKHTVEETVKRAKELEHIKKRCDIGWVGPVQGGRYLDLITVSAQEMSKLPFDVHALGSPTTVMEHYIFDLLVDMILTAKMNLPSSRPFHLFGAGHPFMFSLAVALGCDLFDSAAYSIFAQEDRYLTERGTVHLEKLEYLPCSCPVCVKKNPKDLAELPKIERERELTRHNLHVCFSEIRRIKQAIVEGRLWEHVEMRAHGHPALLQALKCVGKYSEYIERNSPVTKKSGLFFFGSVGLVRPEVVRHKQRLLERYAPSEEAKVLLLLPDFGSRSIRKFRRYKKIVKIVCEKMGFEKSEVHVCVYSPPFGIIPAELGEVYPLSQYEYTHPPDYETTEYVAQQVAEYVKIMSYKKIILFKESGTWQEKVSKACSLICTKKGINFEVLNLKSR